MNPLESVQPAQLQLGPSLGGGGFAEVRRARIHLPDGRKLTVAVKILRDHRAHVPEELREFRAEIQLSRQLHHPNIATTYCDLQLEGRLAMVMELVPGITLHNLIQFLKRRSEFLSVEACALLLVQAAQGMHYAWEGTDVEGRPFGIVHRDLKPANLMLSKRAELKVLDFGVAKTKHRATLTHAGLVKGTLQYLSPEQAAGSRGLTHASDQFALGSILYELIQLRPLYPSEAPAVALGRVLQADKGEALAQLRPEAQVLRPMLERMLERHPGARYPSHQAVADALARFLEHPETVETARLELISVVARAMDQLRPPRPDRRDSHSVTTHRRAPSPLPAEAPTVRVQHPAVAKRLPELSQETARLTTLVDAPVRPGPTPPARLNPTRSRVRLAVAGRLLSACLALLVSLPELQLLSQPMRRADAPSDISAASGRKLRTNPETRSSAPVRAGADHDPGITRASMDRTRSSSSSMGQGPGHPSALLTPRPKAVGVAQTSPVKKEEVPRSALVRGDSSHEESIQRTPPAQGQVESPTPRPETPGALGAVASPPILEKEALRPPDPGLIARRLPVPVCFTSWPVLVELWVDDRVYLSEPGIVRLQPGLHRIRIRSQQHREQEFRVEIPASGPVKVHWRFDAHRPDITEEGCR